MTKLALSCMLICFVAVSVVEGQPFADTNAATLQQPPEKLSLTECIDMALRENRTRAIARSSQEIAEAQYKQALSAYWPDVSVEMTGTHLNHDPNFVFPSSTFSLGPLGAQIAESVAATQLTKAGITPASVGLAAYNAALAAATQQAMSQMSGFTLPAQNIKLMDRDILTTSLKMHYPLYTGGKITAMVKQGKMGVAASAAEARRTDLGIVRDAKQYYYGSILAR